MFYSVFARSFPVPMARLATHRISGELELSREVRTMSLHHNVVALSRRAAIAAVLGTCWLAAMDRAHAQFVTQQVGGRSEERRVGKECRL